MFINFFYELKKAKVPVSLKEYLTLLEAMAHNVPEYSVDNFYYLSRSCLVKDERNLDKFDRVFGTVFKGLEPPEDGISAEIPEEWLRKLTEKFLTDEEKAQIEALGGWEKLMEELKKRLEEQKKRHQGGSRWRCAGCANSPARARRTSSTSTAPSTPPPRTAATSTSRCAPNGAIR
jgi:uncharacterized protein with von Willebrand factor type A (vWA) domain